MYIYKYLRLQPLPLNPFCCCLIHDLPYMLVCAGGGGQPVAIFRERMHRFPPCSPPASSSRNVLDCMWGPSCQP